MDNINWKVTAQEVKQEMVSADNRWHITMNQKGKEKSNFFMSNYDLLLTPNGSASDFRDCFASFIEISQIYTKVTVNIEL
jgi:hypothetical protein